MWAVYAATIDQRDLHWYELHHTGAQVLAEQHRLWYREDVKPHSVGTDRFDFEGKVYPNKQPGSILAGALVYALLRPLGADYLHSYFLTGALATLFTSALATAIAALLVYRLALRWTGDERWSLLAAIGYGLGSTAWPYTGTLHHDAMAAAFLFAGFYFMERRAFSSGSLLGLAMTTSMLTWILSAILAAAFVLRRGEDRRVRFVLGILAGLVPLFVYNYVAFHNSFGQAVVVGGHSVYLPAGLDRGSLDLLWEYARLLVAYTPATVLGLAGALFLPAQHRRERNLLLVLAAAQIAFVVIVHADGACQFGPRMLLPLLPFAATGLAGLACVRRRALAASVAVARVVVAVGFNLLGALYGTHFCPHDRWAVEH